MQQPFTIALYNYIQWSPSIKTRLLILGKYGLYRGVVFQEGAGQFQGIGAKEMVLIEGWSLKRGDFREGDHCTNIALYGLVEVSGTVCLL